MLTEIDCPSTVDLLLSHRSSLPTPEDERIRVHAIHCSLCAAAMRSLAHTTLPPSVLPPPALVTSSRASAAQFAAALRATPPPQILPGQLWVTRPDPAYPHASTVLPRMVVVLRSDPDPLFTRVTVAPLSIETQQRTDRDFLLFADDHPLSYSAMIEVWNEATLPLYQLHNCVGTLPPSLQHGVRRVYQAWMGFPVALDDLVDRLGAPVLDRDDPRVVFQQTELDDCSYLRWSLVHEALLTEHIEVQSLLTLARQRGLSLIQLAERVRLSPPVVRLIDLCGVRPATLPRAVLAAFADALAVPIARVATALSQSPQPVTQASFYSKKAPVTPPQQDWQSILNDRTLTKDQREYWRAASEEQSTLLP